ncbi:MAG: transcriptional regulator NrdR [Candidatus Dojkabacteria bacterium]
MKCPYCNKTRTKVVDKRDNDEEGTTRRRRECLDCHKRFTTYEQVVNLDLQVLKRDGTSEDFDRNKLFKSISKAVNPNILTEDDVEKIVDEIEMMLLNRKSTQINSKDIGNMVLTRLKKADPLAYMRFASIYKDFKSIKELKEELKNL